MANTEAEQIQRIMKGLKCSEAEAREIYEADKAIDHGERMEFDLSPEQEKMAKKMCNAGRKAPTAFKFTTRERKANPTKAGIIEALFGFLTADTIYEDVTVTNKERQITFAMMGENYELTLVQKRKPKK